MQMRVVDSTDGQYIGFIFDGDLREIKLPGGDIFKVTHILPLVNGVRFSNSNYVIDAEVCSGQNNE